MEEKARIWIAGSCYECPCFRDCCAPSCGFDPELDWSPEVHPRPGEEEHPNCPLKRQDVLLRSRTTRG